MPLPSAPKKSSRLRLYAFLIALLGIVGFYVWERYYAEETISPEQFLRHPVKRETLRFGLTQRGTLESADNRELVCRVKAGNRGSSSSYIRWVIDEGTFVRRGQKVLELDDSALQDLRRTQKISYDKAKQEFEAARQNLIIVEKQNLSDITTAEQAVINAELTLDKYTGFTGRPAAAVMGGLLLGWEAVHKKSEYVPEQGEFRQTLDDIRGRIQLAEADFQQQVERVAYAERMLRKGFFTPTQAQAERSRMDSYREALRKVTMERDTLLLFERPRMERELRGKLTEALSALDRTIIQAEAKLEQARSDLNTKSSILDSEELELREIDEQIALCMITAPDDGLVVYVQPESSRWGMGNQSIIQQGEAVREGQKLIRIPDLSRMTVTIKVHESIVRSVRGDRYESTGFAEALDDFRNAMITTPLTAGTSWLNVVHEEQSIINNLSDRFRDESRQRVEKGQPASIRVLGVLDRPLRGHVKSVATVASIDFAAPDVKMFQAVIAIDEPLQGTIKPGMTAEVTIELKQSKDNVLAIPVQALMIGSEKGSKRKIWVETANGPEEREIEVGVGNETMVEVKSGLEEGEIVILNPSIFIKDPKAKAKQAEREGEKAKTGGKEGFSKDAGAKDGKRSSGKGPPK